MKIKYDPRANVDVFYWRNQHFVFYPNGKTTRNMKRNLNEFLSYTNKMRHTKSNKEIT